MPAVPNPSYDRWQTDYHDNKDRFLTSDPSGLSDEVAGEYVDNWDDSSQHTPGIRRRSDWLGIRKDDIHNDPAYESQEYPIKDLIRIFDSYVSSLPLAHSTYLHLH